MLAKYRDHLPQLSNNLFMTIGGLETTLVFHVGINLPYFAAFKLLKNHEGCKILLKEYEKYAIIARNFKIGFILESAT